MLSKQLLRWLFVLFYAFAGLAQAAVNEKEQQTVNDQKIKLNTLQLINEASRLVENTAYPEPGRIKIYLSHGRGKFFSLEKVSVLIDGQDKSAFSYNKAQQNALLRGGSNRIYIGSLSEGIHEIVVVFHGHDRRHNVIKKAKTWLYDKHPGAVIALIKVSDDELKRRPEFSFNIIKGQ